MAIPCRWRRTGEDHDILPDHGFTRSAIARRPEIDRLMANRWIMVGEPPPGHRRSSPLPAPVAAAGGAGSVRGDSRSALCRGIRSCWRGSSRRGSRLGRQEPDRRNSVPDPGRFRAVASVRDGLRCAPNATQCARLNRWSGEGSREQCEENTLEDTASPVGETTDTVHYQRPQLREPFVRYRGRAVCSLPAGAGTTGSKSRGSRMDPIVPDTEPFVRVMVLAWTCTALTRRTLVRFDSRPAIRTAMRLHDAHCDVIQCS